MSGVGVRPTRSNFRGGSRSVVRRCGNHGFSRRDTFSRLEKTHERPFRQVHLRGPNCVVISRTRSQFTVTETVAPTGVLTNHTLYKMTYRQRMPRDEQLFVVFSSAPLRLELDLDFGRGWPPEYHNTINVSELLAVESPGSEIEVASGVHAGFGDRHETFEQYKALSRALQQHGDRFFANDQSLWDAVRQLRQARLEERHNVETARSAELAFKRQDWQRAIDLLEGLGNNRTKLQAARLAFARKQLGT